MNVRRLLVVVLLMTALPGAATGTAAAAGRAATSRPPVSWAAPRLIEAAPPFATLAQPGAIACPTSSTCLAVGDAGTVVSSTAGVQTVTAGVDGGATLEAISCPSARLCVIAETNALLTSTDPVAAHPTWRRDGFRLGDSSQLQGVTCASASLCLAWEDSENVLMSTDPAAGAHAWAKRALPLATGTFIDAAACAPASTLCVLSVDPRGLSGGGSFLTATDAAAAAPAWRLTSAPAAEAVDALSCASSALCVGYKQGDVETSTDPAAGASSWSAGEIAASPTGIVGLDCPDTSTCVAALSTGAIASTTTPAAGAPSWTTSAVVDPAGFAVPYHGGLACPRAGTCLISDPGPGLATVTVGPPASATVATGLGGTTALTGLTCPMVDLCLGTDAGGGIVRTATPLGTAADWQRTLEPDAATGLNDVDCVGAGFCVATGNDDVVETTSDPAGAAPWTETRLGFHTVADDGTYQDDLEGISCPSTQLCVMGNSGTGILVSHDPAAAAPSWHLDDVGANLAVAPFFESVACPTIALCVAGSPDGLVAVSTHPATSAPRWRLARLATGPGPGTAAIESVACPSVHLCVAGDESGAVHWSTHPAAGASAWHRVSLGDGRLLSIACPSAHLCIVSGNRDHVFTTTDPTGPRSAWHEVTLATGGPRDRQCRGPQPDRGGLCAGPILSGHHRDRGRLPGDDHERVTSPAVPEPLLHTIDVGLRWRDIDLFGHVNQSVYHELLEEVRVVLLADLFRRGGERPNRGGFVVRHVDLDYHHEVRRDHDRVTLTAKVVHVGTSSIRIYQEVLLPDGTVAASGNAVLVGWDSEARGKREITDAERALLTGE